MQAVHKVAKETVVLTMTTYNCTMHQTLHNSWLVTMLIVAEYTCSAVGLLSSAVLIFSVTKTSLVSVSVMAKRECVEERF